MATVVGTHDHWAFIVMPPGHGKSMLHSPARNLYEADQLVPYVNDEHLTKLRKEAKAAGNWDLFDQEWGAQLALRLPSNSILMVPHRNIGMAAGLTYLGACYLHTSTWTENLKNRKGSVEKYRSCRYDAEQDGELMLTNTHTVNWISRKLELWFQKPKVYDSDGRLVVEE